MIKITTKDPKIIQKDGESFKNSIENIDLSNIIDKITDRAKDVHRYTDRTGNLSNSIKNSNVKGSSKIYIDRVKAKYGQYIHDGTKSWRKDPFIEESIDFYQEELDKEVVNQIESKLK